MFFFTANWLITKNSSEDLVVLPCLAIRKSTIMYSEYYAGQYQGSEGHAMPVAHGLQKTKTFGDFISLIITNSSYLDPSKCTVHVGNVESHFTENDLLSYFQHYGPVARVKMAGY
tara:strand:+ start:917 stop:1261 length:345 start_codon:yes stop_codon:yes gene_type:complete